MNKRQSKKKQKRERYLINGLGFPVTYREEREWSRAHHEYLVSICCRNRLLNKVDTMMAEIIGIPYKYGENSYKYPNRGARKALKKAREPVYEG